jgi:hypothetical protein
MDKELSLVEALEELFDSLEDILEPISLEVGKIILDDPTVWEIVQGPGSFQDFEDAYDKVKPQVISMKPETFLMLPDRGMFMRGFSNQLYFHAAAVQLDDVLPLGEIRFYKTDGSGGVKLVLLNAPIYNSSVSWPNHHILGGLKMPSPPRSHAHITGLNLLP